MKPFQRYRMVATVLLTLFTSLTCAGADPTTAAAKAWADSLACEAAGDYQGAIARMSDFSDVYSDPYLVSVRTGWLCYMQRDYARAAMNYQDASKASPNALTPYLGLIYTYEAAKLPEKTKEACQGLLQRDPLNSTALKTLGAMSYEQGDYTSAAHYYAILVDAHPEEPAYLSGAGWSYLKLRKNHEAAMVFERLLILSPTYAYASAGYKAATDDATN